jgi:23S rRNA (cytidine2498-2'-O)-methyltransferase
VDRASSSAVEDVRRRIFVATPGFERAVAAELPAALGAKAADVDGDGDGDTDGAADGVAGIVGAREPAADASPLDVVFARQQLPAAVEVRAASITALAEAAFAAVESAVDRARGPFTLHAFTWTGAAPGVGSRASHVGRETLALLRARRRRAARAYRAPDQTASVFASGGLLIQILMIDRGRAWVSAATPRALPGGGWDLSPFPGGIAEVADDRRPPSRAYRKLEEAFLWLGDAPGARDLCVDLGGAPGGWSYAALRRGARVIAVDRAALQPPVRGNPRLTAIEGNAFTYEPPARALPVDWLLCDVICEPARTRDLLAQWLGRGWCRKLIATIKFKGADGYAMLGGVRAALEAAGAGLLLIKHLHHNKNEVTVMARAVEQGVQAPATPHPRGRLR